MYGLAVFTVQHAAKAPIGNSTTPSIPDDGLVLAETGQGLSCALEWSPAHKDWMYIIIIARPLYVPRRRRPVSGQGPFGRMAAGSEPWPRAPVALPTPWKHGP